MAEVGPAASRVASRACLLVGAAVLAFVAVRAVRVPLTFDEAVTYERTIATDLASIFEFRTATNHFLNTVLTRLSHAVFGSAPWALRLPNVLACAGYLIALGAVARRVRHPLVAVAGFVLLATNLYVTDYFAVSRGYGLAIAALTGAMACLLEWLAMPASPRSSLTLAASGTCAVLAVAANFAVLPALLGLVAVALVRLLWIRAPGVAPANATAPAAARPWLIPAVWLALTAAFSIMVFSRDRILSQALFAPLSVRAIGLFDDERAAIEVLREDVRTSLRPLDRDADGVWRTGAVQDTWGLRVALPAAVDHDLASLEVRIGPHVFTRTRRDPGPWEVRESEGHRLLVSTTALAAPRSAVPGLAGAINWVSDGLLWRVAAWHTGGVLALVVGLAAALSLLRRLAIGARWLGPRESRVLAWTLVAAASVCAAPLYLLRRNGDLYFGAATLLETLRSLVYGTSYVYAVSPEVMGAIGWTVACVALAAVAAWAASARARPALGGPVAVLAIVVLVLLQSRVQHALLGTPYLLGRTALFLVPLAGLCFWGVADAAAGWGRAARAGVSTLMVALAAASAWHFVTASNMSRIYDDYADASTPDMARAVAERVGALSSPPAVVHVGVEWMFLPAARYYIGRLPSSGTRYETVVLPGDGVVPDFVYARSAEFAQGAQVREFPLSRATLWQAAPPAAR